MLIFAATRLCVLKGKIVKKLILVIATVLGAAASADSDKLYSVECNLKDDRNVGFEELNVKANLILEDWMKEVVVTAVTKDHNDKDVKMVGRRLQWDSDLNYKPRKYKNHVRYQMNKLVDVEDFSDFTPDGCDLNMMVPRNATDLGTFDAPVVTNCEQSGGTMILECKTKVERE